MKTQITYYGQTDMGRQRTNNEDAFVAEQLDNASVLAVAIDGVGGYEGGEVAAEIAQKEIPRYMREFRNGERLELLKQAVVSANNAIFERRQTDAEHPNMSCVLTSAVIDGSRKMIDMVHVGDTRLYQFRHHQLVKLSHDHSLVGYREEMGDLTEEQAMNHPQRNVISRDVGSGRHEVADRDFLEAASFPLLPNSILLFCSDGLTDLVTSRQIIAILDKPASLRQKAAELIAAANNAGGKDNVTVVLVEYQAEEPATPLVNDVPATPQNRPSPKAPAQQEKASSRWLRREWLIALAILAAALCLGAIYYVTRAHLQPKNSAPGSQINIDSLISPAGSESPDEMDTLPQDFVEEYVDDDVYVDEEILPGSTGQVEPSHPAQSYSDREKTPEQLTIEELQKKLAEKEQEISRLQKQIEKQRKLIEQLLKE